jgi:hypothetical protein
MQSSVGVRKRYLAHDLFKATVAGGIIASGREHPPMKILDPSGTRNYSMAMEEEANWLGPALLISDEARAKSWQQAEHDCNAAPIDFVVSSPVTYVRRPDREISTLDGGDRAQRLADLRSPAPPGALLFHHPHG